MIQKKIFYQIFGYMPLFVFLLLIFPFISEVGRNLFQQLGKFYFLAIVAAFCVFTAVRFVIGKRNERDIHTIKRRENSNLWINFVCLLTIYFCLTFFWGNVLDNVAICCIVVIFTLMAAQYAYSYAFLKNFSVISVIILAFFGLTSLFGGQYEYFNTNLYAYIASVLVYMGLIWIYGYKVKYYPFFTCLLLLFGVIVSEAIYKSETQLVCYALCAGYLLFSNRIVKKENRYNWIITVVFALNLLFVPVVVGMIRLGILNEGFITGRGTHYVQAFDVLKSLHIFQGYDTVANSLTAHNGYLELCLKGSIFGAVLVIGALYFLLIKLYLYIKSDRVNRLLLCVILTNLTMNTVEFSFLGLTDCYFLCFEIGILVSRCLYLKRNDKMRLRGGMPCLNPL